MSFHEVEEYGTGRRLNWFSPPAYVFTQAEEFPANPDDRIGKALWMESDGEIYITCAVCGTINSLEGFPIVECNYIIKWIENIATPCIHCRKCEAAFWVHLRDWEKVSEKTRIRKVPTCFRRKLPAGGKT